VRSCSRSSARPPQQQRAKPTFCGGARMVGLLPGCLRTGSAPLPRFLPLLLVLLQRVSVETAAASPPSSSHRAAAARPRYVLHVVADDLGYHDVNWRNEQSITPTLDSLNAEGVEIPEFYVYKFCAASRSSVLTGRYPYHLGMYNNNVDDVPLSYRLLPQLLKQPPPPGAPTWRTHALGKCTYARDARTHERAPPLCCTHMPCFRTGV
jgi:hypothetical protein